MDLKAISGQLTTAVLLKELLEDPRFQMVMAEGSKQRPLVPAYLPSAVRADSDALIEQIKFLSGQQRGFDLLYGILTGVNLGG
jgi:hypothetical protein